MENIRENQKNLSGLEQVYFKQKEKLFSLYNNNLPQSIILSGGEIELLSSIAISFSELIVKNNTSLTFEDFLNIYTDNNHQKSPFVYMITKIYLEDKKKYKNQIYRDDISNIHTFFQTKDDIGQKRVCIINTIDDLTIEASNSLLKLIEEPNKNSHFIIINRNKAKILQTIKSRSYFLNFSKLNEETFFKNLNNDIPINKEDLFNLTKGSLSLSKNFINFELYEIQDHFRELLNDRKLIKPNTASHYSNFISKIFAKDDDISIFFDFIYLIASYEAKSMARQGKEREVLNLLKISEIVKTYRNYFKSLNLDYTTLIVSLFYKIKNV